ncbi:MAG: NAD(P)H-dependent oxidoreductase subunit E, partial [Gemmatimonadetes bacterium]|nr:NAD(P)H-dependent oxidoreductase subunit E [Gemmatimonadota bacterium]
MTSTHNGNLVDAWRGQPAPLLPLLHAFHDRDRFLSDDAIREVAEGLNIPLAELFGTVTFYHHFARNRPGQSAPRVCTGPVCCLRGAGGLVESLDGATPMPCSGRCDEPVPVLAGNRTLVGSPDGTLRELPSPLPPPNPGGCEECVFAGIRLPGRAGIEGYRASGGYEALERALGGMPPEELLDLIADSGLAGRGGAGFPTGQKWRAVAEAPGSPKTVVCNADEGEPGCFKDRALLDYDP